ncbi:MAG TPA: tetratricopeptide repeat protein [Nannocystis sp.]
MSDLRSRPRQGGRGRAGAVASLFAAALVAPGCLTLKAEHDDLARKVDRLETQTIDRSKELDEKVLEADKKLAELQAKLDEAERLLRGSQAGIGMRMEVVEQETQQLRGMAENAELVASATQQALQELRGDVDERLKKLEEKLNEATSIPEGKEELWSEAERQLQRKNFKFSRQLFRTYVSRYPGDARLPEAEFKIGLTFYSERDYKSALGSFYRIIQEYPDAAVLYDALYYSGLGFAKLGQCKNAIAYFEAINRPKSTAPAQYQKAAKEQIAILQKDTGDLCVDREDAGAGAAAKKGVAETEKNTSVRSPAPTSTKKK